METVHTVDSSTLLKATLEACKAATLSGDYDDVIFTIFVKPALEINARQEAKGEFYRFYVNGVPMLMMEHLVAVSPANERLFGVFTHNKKGVLCRIQCGKNLLAVHSFVTKCLPEAITTIQSGTSTEAAMLEVQQTDPPSISLAIPDCLEVHERDGQLIGFSHRSDPDVMTRTAELISAASDCTFRYEEVMGELLDQTTKRLIIARR